MEISIRRIILFRAFELMFICTILSTVCSALNLLHIVSGEQKFGFMLLVAAMVFFFATVVTMLTYYTEPEEFGIYIIANVVAYLIFAAVSVLANFLTSTFDLTTWYIWFFSITSVVKYCFKTDVLTIWTLLVFHGIGMFLVLAVPAIMKLKGRRQY